mmetsp:Transcript_60455/g.70715  ORF Transcript_60455/g.70715 Transcript_60455/m.70715 type:complete len:107 (-) Transcript_60455:1820-2140(-)
MPSCLYALLPKNQKLGGGPDPILSAMVGYNNIRKSRKKTVTLNIVSSTRFVLQPVCYVTGHSKHHTRPSGCKTRELARGVVSNKWKQQFRINCGYGCWFVWCGVYG